MDSSCPRNLPVQEEQPARRPRSKRRSDGTSASRTSSARGTSPARGSSSRQNTSRSIVTAVPAQEDTTGLVPPDDITPGSLFESSGVSDVTFQGFESSRAEGSLPNQDASQKARPDCAPGASSTPVPEEAPQTSTGRSSGIGPYFRPDLLAVEEEDDEDDQPAPQQTAATLPTALRAQVRTVHHLQHGRIEEGLDLVGSLASQMNKEHAAFRDVVRDGLRANEIEQRRAADGLIELQNLIAAEGKARHKEHQQLMGAINILATSTLKLVETSACQQQVSQSMELSQRNSSISLEAMAAALKLISQTLPGMSQLLAGLETPQPTQPPQPPQPPPPASQTPPVPATTASWHGLSQQYQGYAGQYPVMPPPAAQQPAQKSSRRKRRRKKKTTTSSTTTSEWGTDRQGAAVTRLYYFHLLFLHPHRSFSYPRHP